LVSLIGLNIGENQVFKLFYAAVVTCEIEFENMGKDQCVLTN
jgi:hypothetical protein